ncbi:hypothetical protein GCM10010499_34880 [Streptomyces thermoviolaceus subsp. apingens]|nr:hypothetical protein GCM10010499_34880 [Streptomyces thermoviolaceus subsp. apingens]
MERAAEWLVQSRAASRDHRRAALMLMPRVSLSTDAGRSAGSGSRTVFRPGRARARLVGMVEAGRPKLLSEAGHQCGRAVDRVAPVSYRAVSDAAPSC